MITSTLGILSISTYLISTALLSKDLIKCHSNKSSIAPAWIAVALHFSYSFTTFYSQATLNFSLFNTASLISSLVALLLLLTTINKPVEKLGLAIFPLAAICLSASLIFTDQRVVVEITSWQMSTHILSSIIAFSLLSIAALQAILLAIQEQQLRNHPPKKFIHTLPPLQTMEALLFQMISTGLLFLSISLVSGFIFIDDLFAQHLAHKTILALIAWITFTWLLIGRIKYGWRGQTAIKWTLVGFSLLLLAYFGSKLVLELILQRT